MKLPDVWRCTICGAYISRFEYHDCKPVPRAKYQEAQAEIERLRTALSRIMREAGFAKISNWNTRADAIEHIMRLSRYAEDALSPPPPTASAGAPEAMPPRETKGTT